MIKWQYIAGAALVLFFVKSKKTEGEKNQITDTVASQRGSDWIGTAWDRLSGADLYAPGYTNANGEISADFSKVTRRDMKINPAWDGSLGGTA